MDSNWCRFGLFRSKQFWILSQHLPGETRENYVIFLSAYPVTRSDVNQEFKYIYIYIYSNAFIHLSIAKVYVVESISSRPYIQKPRQMENAVRDI